MRAYEAECWQMQHLIEGAVHDLERAYVADPAGFARGYDRVALSGNGGDRLMEVDVGGGPRMIVHWDKNMLTLVDVGDHEVVARADRIDLKKALRESSPAPRQFRLATRSMFLQSPERGFRAYANELSPEWVYHLDPEQAAVHAAVLDSACDLLESYARGAVHFIVGGPGTGKTSILLSVLKDIADLGDYRIHLGLSDALKNHIERCLPTVDLTPFTRTPLESAQIILVDDPRSKSDIVHAATQPRYGPARVVVLAFDPLQLSSAISDEDLSQLLRRFKGIQHSLRVCYRQKENVGLAARRVMEVLAASTPYSREDNVRNHREERAGVTRVSNDLSYPNPMGYAWVYPAARPEDLKGELERIKRQPGGLWSNTPPLLVATVSDGSHPLPVWFQKLLDASGVPYLLTDTEASVKGLEFQHVFIVTPERLLGDLEAGFSGTGKMIWNTRRLFRIPFSRAKDSIVTFGVS